MSIINTVLSMLRNRKYIKQNLNIGKNTKILTRLEYFGSEPYLIEIGDNCVVTSGVRFITHDGAIGVAMKVLQNKELKDTYGKYTKFGKIVIEDNCFIGINSIIMPNVTIGTNSIVAAGSLVTKNVPRGAVVGGSPAKMICTIEEYAEKALKQTIETNETDLDKRKEIILDFVNSQ